MFEKTTKNTHAKTIESLEVIKIRAAETLRRSQIEARDALIKSHEETAEIMKQSHEKYSIFSLHLQKKNQEALDELKKLTLTLIDKPDSKAISCAIQSVIDTIIATDKTSRVFEQDESERLRSFLDFKASALKVLQENQAQKLIVLQQNDSAKITDNLENLTDNSQKPQKKDTIFDIPGIRHSI